MRIRKKIWDYLCDSAPYVYYSLHIYYFLGKGNMFIRGHNIQFSATGKLI
jgi:hypothetical protein